VVHALLLGAGQHDDLVRRAAGAAQAERAPLLLGGQAERAVEALGDRQVGYLQAHPRQTNDLGFVHFATPHAC
jgi:hypothetical protein